MSDDAGTFAGVAWVVVFWAVYFYWQRRRYLAGKTAWFPAILFIPLMLLTGYRPQRGDGPKAEHLFDHLVIHADRPGPLAYWAYLRNGKRIARFLKRADDLWMRRKPTDDLIALPSGRGESPRQRDVARLR